MEKVKKIIGCSHSSSVCLALGIAFCRDCGRVFVNNNNGTTSTYRATGYITNNNIKHEKAKQKS